MSPIYGFLYSLGMNLLRVALNDLTREALFPYPYATVISDEYRIFFAGSNLKYSLEHFERHTLQQLPFTLRVLQN